MKENRALLPQSANGAAIQCARLESLMTRTEGSALVSVAIIDGPVAPDLGLKVLEPGASPRMQTGEGVTYEHGTFVASLLASPRSAGVPGICPGCTLLTRPLLDSGAHGAKLGLTANASELAAAIIACVNSKVHIINLSLSVANLGSSTQSELETALDLAADAGVIIVAASGNHGLIGGSPLTRHPWVITVVACDTHGQVLNNSNLSAAIGARGLRAPGKQITGLTSTGSPRVAEGTSAAAPFVTGAAALLWSEFPHTDAHQIKRALMVPHRGLRPRLVPPTLNAEASVAALLAAGEPASLQKEG